HVRTGPMDCVPGRGASSPTTSMCLLRVLDSTINPCNGDAMASLPPPVPEGAWFNPIAEHLGPAYWAPDTGRVMAFTKGTEQEVDHLVGALGLAPGDRVLDVGCGPGRHALALARRGYEVVGVDLSPDFIALAREAADTEGLPATFEVVDVRNLDYDAEFEAAICLCQGGFGLLGGHDEAAVFGRIVEAVRLGRGL